MKTIKLSLITILLSLFSWNDCAFAHKSSTTTPIKYLVVLFQENRAFDHYFGIYPHAQNNPGEPTFTPKRNTPTVNGFSPGLLHLNQNSAQPFRLSPDQVNTSNPAHDYTVLQEACDKGLMDKFVETTGQVCTPPKIVMGYFDGNTVTALWNYAQHFALSDNFHTTTICASTVGAINLISGQAHGTNVPFLTHKGLPAAFDSTLINDVDPKFDNCSGKTTVALEGKNVGNLLNKKDVTWGWFQGGFADCDATHMGPNGPVVDYVPHHAAFQYYRSTSNPKHLPPSSPDMIGKTDQANHNYDISDFWVAVEEGNMPSVSFLKAPAYQNGHSGNSTPLLEQQFLVNTINRLQNTPQWKHMAIIIAYDDSGGWYDHEMPPIINDSQIAPDALTGPGTVGTNPPLGGYQGRPSYGFRVPLIVISPWAKCNYVDNTVLDQTSILRFIEDNWELGRIGNFSFDKFASSIVSLFDFKERHNRTLLLDPLTGQVVCSSDCD